MDIGYVGAFQEEKAMVIGKGRKRKKKDRENWKTEFAGVIVEKENVAIVKTKEEINILLAEMEEEERKDEWVIKENQGWESIYWDDVAGKELDN